MWSACERFGILPPGIAPSWDDCGVDAQARLLAYNQFRAHDELEINAALAGAKL